MGDIEKNRSDGMAASADELLRKLNENIRGNDKSPREDEGAIGRELNDIRKKIKDEEPSFESDDAEDLLSDFFEKEISEVELPEDDPENTGNKLLDFETDIDDGAAYDFMNDDSGYVADHSDSDGSTKIASLDGGLVEKDVDQGVDGGSDAKKENHEEDIDNVDIGLMRTFGQEDDLAEMIGEARVKEIDDDVESEAKFIEEVDNKSFMEYTEPEQTEEIVASYGKKHKTALLSFAAVSLFLLLSLIFENISKAGAGVPDIFRHSAYPVVYIMIELQMLLLAAACAYIPLIRGCKTLFSLKPLPESLIALTVFVSVIYDIIIAAALPNYSYGVYSFPVILGIWLLTLGELISVKREIMSFSVVSSKSPKFALSKLNIESSALETETFFEYLPDKPSIYKICKADFIDNYFRRSAGVMNGKSGMGIVLPVSFVLFLIFFFAGMIIKHDAGTGLITGYSALMFCAPLSMLLAFSYPLFKASKDAFSDDGAIIGELSTEEYANATVISFDDKEVFPSYGVKVKSVKIYGNNRIDKVIYNTASVFSAVGGPLSDVFDVATVELGKSKDVELKEILPDGIEALVDGVRVCAGKADYVSRQGLTPYYDMEDDQIENSGDISIMYVICANAVAAKMYIQYITDPDFEVLLGQLKRTGVCVGIKTLDPNIDDRLLSSGIDLEKYPVRIIRCREIEDMNADAEKADSGIVSKHSAKGLLKLVSICDRARNAIRTSSVISLFSLGIGVLISIFLMLTNMTGDISSFLIGLYHIFWALPIVFTSKTLS